MTRALHGILDELLCDTRQSGIPARVEVESSGVQLDIPSAEIARLERSFAARFEEMKRELVRVLGAPRDETRGHAIAAASWERDGAEIRLALEHEDKEAPIVVSLDVAFRGPVPTAVDVACACAGLKLRSHPFFRDVQVYVLAENPSIRKTHERVAEAVLGGEKVALYRCRACGRVRQTGDDRATVFDVPPIDVDAWRAEPYAYPGAHERYERALETYLRTADRTTRDERCRVEGCQAMAVRFSVFCFDHHRDDRPMPPPGRRMA